MGRPAQVEPAAADRVVFGRALYTVEAVLELAGVPDPGDCARSVVERLYLSGWLRRDR